MTTGVDERVSSRGDEPTMTTGVDECMSSRGNDDDSGNNSLTTMVALDDLQSGGDCARTINSTSTIMVRVRVGGVPLHLMH